MVPDYFDITAIGQAPVDIIADVEEDFLSQLGLTKSGHRYINRDEANIIQEKLGAYVLEPGGAAANTAACVQALGGQAAFTGKFSTDEHGRFLLESLNNAGVYATMKPEDSALGSDIVYVFVTPDRERTFAAYYGINRGISTDDLDEDTLKKSRIICLEGYLMEAAQGHRVLLEAGRTGKSYGNLISYSPSDVNVIRKYFEQSLSLLSEADIFIANEQEACALTKTSSILESVSLLRDKVKCGAVTRSHKGAMLFDEKNVLQVPALNMKGKIVNTNGAGDHFAAGFLYGIAKDFSLEKCGKLGILCASEALTHASARPQKSYKNLRESL